MTSVALIRRDDGLLTTGHAVAGSEGRGWVPRQARAQCTARRRRVRPSEHDECPSRLSCRDNSQCCRDREYHRLWRGRYHQNPVSFISNSTPPIGSSL
eukprot:1045571-Rhodomonas_salina.1